MVQELGPQYVKFAISVLRSALPPRGYMAHVQGYTVHAVLQAVMQVLYASHASCSNDLSLHLPGSSSMSYISAAVFARHLALAWTGSRNSDVDHAGTAAQADHTSGVPETDGPG